MQSFQTIEEVLTYLLSSRSIDNSAEFIHPPHPTTITLDSLGFTKEKERLFSLLSSLKEQNKTIVVYTDYDTDGITGGAIMWETLHHLGFTVYPYVPHRQNEGYGFSVKGIDSAIKKYHPSLFISVDHGISARQEIRYITKKGIDVVITDHHTKPDNPPDTAAAVIHCPLLSGSGLAYVVAHEIAMHFGMNDAVKKRLFECDLLALASFGIIADLVPLIGLARSVAYHGLKAVALSSKPGIVALLRTAGLDKTISAYHVGFAIAPRINAVGRLSHAIEALRMLCTTNNIRAEELALQASHFNTKRQDLVERSVQEALALVDDVRLPRIVVVEQTSWNEGVIGLIASKLVEKWFLPAVVLTKTTEGWKGSARSIPGFDITSFLRSLHILTHVGGHPQAAGFSVSDDNKDAFIRALISESEKLPQFDRRKQHVDAIIPLNLVTLELAERLSEWEPFGIGNPRPLFQSKITISRVNSVGKSQTHRKLVVHDPNNDNIRLEMIYFSPKPEQLKRLTPKSTVDCVYSVDINEWNGARKVVCQIKMIV